MLFNFFAYVSKALLFRSLCSITPINVNAFYTIGEEEGENTSEERDG